MNGDITRNELAKVLTDELDNNIHSINTISTQLAEKAAQIDTLNTNKAEKTDLNITNNNVTSNTNALSLKRDKSVPIKGSEIDISSDANKIGLDQLQDAVKQSMAGTTSINSSVDGKAVTEEKYAPNSIKPNHTNFISIGKNLFNKDTATLGYFVDYTNGNITVNASYNCSDFIPVTPNGVYSYSCVKNQHFAFYDKNKVYISNATNSLANPFTAPSNAYYVRVSLLATDGLDKTQIETGSASTGYEAFNYKLSNYIDTSKNLPSKSVNINMISDRVGRYDTGKNLFNKYTSVDNYFPSWTNGLNQYNISYFASDYIPVSPSTTYKSNATVIVCEYDKDYKFIKGTQTVTDAFTVSATTYFIKLGYKYADIAKDSAQLELGSTSTSYEAFTLKYPLSVGNTPIKPLDLNNWNNKILSTFGDSITQQGKWQPYVTQKFNFNLNNYGIGGTRISDGTGSDTTAMCRDERINTIASNSDIITVMGGTNDWAQNVSLGIFSRSNVDTSTFYGACNVMFKKLMTAFPSARIICMGTPFGIFPNRVGWTDTTGLLNNQNLMTIDYGKALMDIARLWGIPIIDIGGQSGWNEVNIATFVTNDGAYLHPNDEGAKRIASLIIGKLKSIEPVS